MIYNFLYEITINLDINILTDIEKDEQEETNHLS